MIDITLNKIKKEIRNIAAKFGYQVFLLSLLIGQAFLGGCTDKDLEVAESGGSKEVADVEESLVFTVDLAKERSSRADATDIDDYVDTDNLFQVLLFSQNGDFLFESKDRIVEPSGDIAGQWYVTIPLSKNIKDGNNNIIPLSLIKSQLEKEPFKIAVLANWPSGKVNWGWNESALNSVAVANGKVKNVNDLHHLEYDSYYKQRSVAYGFIADSDFNMGIKTDWVQMRTDDKGRNYERKGSEDTRWTADRWIRTYWNPSLDIETTPNPDPTRRNKGLYAKMWQFWNFGISMDDNADDMSYPKIWTADDSNLDESYTDWDFKWQERNGEALKKLFVYKEDDEDKEYDHLSDLSQDQIDAAYSYAAGNIGTNNIDGMTIDLKKNITSTVGQIQIYNKDGRYGIILPETDNWDFAQKENDGYTKDSKPRIPLSTPDKAHGYVQFKAYGTGTLRIKCSYIDGSDNKARLVIQRGSNCEKDLDVTSTSPTSVIANISITQDPEDISIFCRKGKVAIYAIEWVCNKYLYDTDREGVMPTVSNPIPMYGIQNFPKIENWTKDAVLNVSRNGLNINLVRALAKVELYLPNEAQMVFMRSMNRMSRCEPMDVETPTYQGWTKYTGTSVHDAAHCEWFDIFKYGPGYQNSAKFIDYYSWFYGTWKKTRKNDGTYEDKTTGWKWPLRGAAVPEKESYPHIFNPDVERSDFCEMIYEGQSEGYYKYVLYMPDKAIDDPNEAGDLTESPKVPHIEYRYADMDCFLDDNNCRRVYFTDYIGNITGKNTVIGSTASADFDAYEENADNLKHHWPIMRNHKYKFYIGGSYESQEIYVKVEEWGEPAYPKKEEW